MNPLPNYDQYLSSPDISKAQSAYNSAQTTANQYQSDASTLPGKLQDAINQKLNYNQDLITQKNKAMTDYFSAPATARQDYADIVNPYDRENLVTKAVAGSLGNYTNMNDILNARLGSISDAVNSGVAGWQSQVSAAQGAAGLAQTNLASLIQNAKDRLAAAQWNYQAQPKPAAGGHIDPTSFLNKHFNNESSAPAASDWEVMPSFKNALEYNKWLGTHSNNGPT